VGEFWYSVPVTVLPWISAPPLAKIPLPAIRDDDIVLNCGCGGVDVDSAGGLAGGGLGAPVLNAEAGEDAGSKLLGLESNDCQSPIAATVNDGHCGSCGAGDGDGFAEEVDIFDVGAGGDEITDDLIHELMRTDGIRVIAARDLADPAPFRSVQTRSEIHLQNQ
jgi:hypothetical protein